MFYLRFFSLIKCNNFQPKKEAIVLNPTLIASWLKLAEDDYLASRVLLNSRLLVQGCIMASTSVEKYLKTIHEALGLCFEPKHGIVKLYRRLHEHDNNFKLNEDFLYMLDKVYKIRYPDEISEGFNFAINHIKSLVCMDETVDNIRRHMSKHKVFYNENDRKNRFEDLITKKNECLFKNNYIYLNIPRGNLFSQFYLWYEFRLTEGNWMDFSYFENVKDDNRFNLKGLEKTNNNSEFKTQAGGLIKLIRKVSK